MLFNNLQLPHLVAPLIDDYCDDVRVIHKLAEHRGPSEPCDNTKTSSEGFFQPGVGRSTFFDYGVKKSIVQSRRPCWLMNNHTAVKAPSLSALAIWLTISPEAWLTLVVCSLALCRLWAGSEIVLSLNVQSTCCQILPNQPLHWFVNSDWFKACRSHLRNLEVRVLDNDLTCQRQRFVG